MPSEQSEPMVVIAGRPNVGKSTLVNRIIGRRVTVVEDVPGVTRDRLEISTDWLGIPFTIVDTGGWQSSVDGLQGKVSQEAKKAIEYADVVVVVTDVSVGVTDTDMEIARHVKRLDKPALLVANKSDNSRRDIDAWEMLSLGLGDPIPLSALHGRRVDDLLDAVVKIIDNNAIEHSNHKLKGENMTLTDTTDTSKLEETSNGDYPRIALVGRPNVGKSTLFNFLIGQDRSIVHDMPGTTRDAVDTVVETDSGTFCFIDTAGMRHKDSKGGRVEHFSVLRSLDVIDNADLVLMLIDATEGITRQDQRIVERAVQSGSPVIVIVNKWDIVAHDTRDELINNIENELAFVGDPPIIRVSAKTGLGVQKIFPAIQDALSAYHHRIPTGELNRALRMIQEKQVAPSGARIKFIVQGAVDPPTFVLFTNKRLPATYLRFVESRLKEQFGLERTPIKLKVHTGDGK